MPLVQKGFRRWGSGCALALVLAACSRDDVRLEAAVVTPEPIEEATNFFDAPPSDDVQSAVRSSIQASAPSFLIPPLSIPAMEKTGAVLAMDAEAKIAPLPSAARPPLAAPKAASRSTPVRMADIGGNTGGSIYRGPGKKPPTKPVKDSKPDKPTPVQGNPAPGPAPGKEWADRDWSDHRKTGATPAPPPPPATQAAKITVIDTNIVGASAAKQMIGASVGSSSPAQGSLVSANVLPKDNKVDGLVVVAVNGKTLLGGGDAPLININAFKNGTPGGGVLATVAAVTAPVAAAAAPVVAAAAPAVDTTASVVAPVVDTVGTVAAPVVAAAAPVVAPVVAPIAPVIAPIVAPIAPIVAPIVNPAAPGISGAGLGATLGGVVSGVGAAAGGLLGGVAPSSH